MNPRTTQGTTIPIMDNIQLGTTLFSNSVPTSDTAPPRDESTTFFTQQLEYPDDQNAGILHMDKDPSTMEQFQQLNHSKLRGVLQDSIFCTQDPRESANSWEDADPGSSASGGREGNTTDKVADPGFVKTTGVGNMTQQRGDIDHIQPCVEHISRNLELVGTFCPSSISGREFYGSSYST
jgi:hypothetical protein